MGGEVKDFNLIYVWFAREGKGRGFITILPFYPRLKKN
jgi:hypothetical protein